MNYGDYLGELCEQIAQNIGIPKENALCVMRTQGNGAQLVTNRKGAVVAINAAVPFGGYIRQEGRYTAERGGGCATHKYQTICHAIVHERGGDSLRLADRVVAAIVNSGIKERIDLIDIDRVYEDIAAEELASAQTIPTQGDLAVVRVRFVLVFTLLDCELLPETCEVIAPAPPLPTDLQVFFQNTGITDPAITTPITVFYNTASTRSYWSKRKAFYPYVGGNANAHKYNLFNPLDTNAAFRLSFFGGWTHTAFGVQPNGINAYADTHYIESAQNVVGRGSFGFYSRTNTGSVQTCDMGALDGANASTIFPRVTIINPDRLYMSNGSVGAAFVGGQTSTIRLYQNNRAINPEIRARINSAFVVLPEAFTGQCGFSYFISALNNVGSPQFYSARALGCSYIFNDGLTDAEMIDLETDVNVLMTALGRAV